MTNRSKPIRENTPEAQAKLQQRRADRAKRPRQAVTAQMTHASSGKARKKRREH